MVTTLNAGATATLLKTRTAASKAVKPGVWHASFSKAKSYATEHGVPLIAVWSNGDACGHCVIFESACNSSYFKKWMKSSGCVFYFTYSGESAGKVGGTVFHWCRKNKNTSYPFVRIYWPKGGVDVATVGDTVDGVQSGTAGGKKAVSYFKKKLKKFFSSTTSTTTAAAVKPYTIEFDPNGATNEMAAVKTKVGATITLPACTLVRNDYAFAGWAKAADGSVAYKDKASVKNLTTVSNGVVTLYAKWTRVTYRTYYTGIKYTIGMSDCKGWTTSTKVPGMKWTKSTGKWTGTPTTAKVYSIKFKKGSSSKTRRIVVVKDSIKFADESVTQRVAAAGEPLTLELFPTSQAGDVKSVTVTGLPDGLSYAGGQISGTPTQVGTFKVTVVAVSATGQKLTRTFSIVLGVPDCCIGTFNGFIGFADANRQDPLALINRGMFKLSAPSNANLSAKVVTAKGTYAFTGLGWTRNGDGTYTATLKTSGDKDTLTVMVGGQSGAAESEFCVIGVFLPSYGTAYDVWAQRSPFERDAKGAYLDAAVGEQMAKVVGKWYFKVYAVGSQWVLAYTTAKAANLTLSVAADGTATLAGKVGSLKVSASSAVFIFGEDVETGFVRSEFAVPVTVSKVKKTLDIWLKLWFDRDPEHSFESDEGVGAAEVEAFK
jgi:uncharacterized repeat protein (TIGR02543 family)